MDKDWVTRHSGNIGHSVAMHLVAWALRVLGTGSPRHSVARHSVAKSILLLHSDFHIVLPKIKRLVLFSISA